MPLTLVRHTTPDIASGICYGSLDVDVAATFAAEAATVCAQLQGSYDHVFSSPLLRCRRLADFTGFPYTVDARLREIDFGAWEGRTWDDIGKVALDAWAADVTGFQFPGGESVAQMEARVAALVDDLPDARNVFITHGGVIRVIRGLLTGNTLEATLHFSPPFGVVLRTDTW